MQTIKREIVQLFMSQSTRVALQHTLQPSLHVTGRQIDKE
jgi:hypothetical protein